MKNVILTIDTEGHDGKNPIEKLIWGKAVDGKEYGINHIMDICDRFAVKALFFVDIAEAWDYGKEKIAEVATHIRNRGHDVGVHVHPDHMADKSRLFLWEYTREEQFEIIKKCTDLYVEIMGEHPLAFRAGKYGANRDTLDVLDELGYKFDFSQFYGQKWCGINPPVAINTPVKYKSIIEIPVTIYESISVGKFRRYDKIDATMNLSEYKYIMDKSVNLADNLIITLFYHSFSMLYWRDDPDSVSVNKKEESKFIKTLAYITNSSDYKFISLKDLTNEKLGDIFENNSNCIYKIKNPIISIWFTILKAFRIKKYNKKAKLLVNGLIIFCLIIAVIIISMILN